MGDWANTVADQHYDPGFFGVTPSATANTKGAWGGYTAGKYGCGLMVHVSWCQNYSTSRTFMFDVGIGESGSQVVLVPNIVFQLSPNGAASSRAHQAELYFPLAVPNEKLWIRAQSSMASHSVGYIYPSVVGGGSPSFGSVCTAYGVDTATSLGTAVTASNTENANGSWVQMTASCQRIRALIVAMNGGTTALSTFNDQWCNFDVGVGPAGSEQVLFSIGEASGSAANTGLQHPQFLGPYNVDIPQGTRISVRTRIQWSSSSQRVRYFSLYGIS